MAKYKQVFNPLTGMFDLVGELNQSLNENQLKDTFSKDFLLRSCENYVGDLPMVPLSVDIVWKVGATEYNNKNIVLENGAKVSFSGKLSLPPMTTTQKKPTVITHNFGDLIEPQKFDANEYDGTSTKTWNFSSISGSYITTYFSKNFAIKAKKNGLFVDGKNIKAATPTDYDTETTTVSVTFLHRIYMFLIDNKNTTLNSLLDNKAIPHDTFLSNSKNKTIKNAVFNNKYIMYAYPEVMGRLSMKLGGFDFNDYTKTEENIVNEYSKAIPYNVYITNNPQNNISSLEIS